MADDLPIYARTLASNLPNHWTIRRFEDLVFFQEGPGIRNWQYVNDADGIPFVNIRCLVNGRLDRAAMNRVSREEAFGKYSHFLLDVDDYVVSSSGTLGRLATVRANDLPCMLNTSVIRMRPRSSSLDRGYLKYFILSRYYQDQIVSFATGSAQLNYGPMHLRQMFIVSPPPREQQAIACILGALDEKIESNRRRNQTLDEMAGAIFKSWFIDFDPVRAKAAGQQPFGLKPNTAALFPDALEESELGEIPAGWRTTPIGDTVQVLGGGTPSTKEPAYWEGGTHPFCTPKDMSSLTEAVLLGTERHLTEDGLAKVSSGQLPVGTVLLSSRAPIGYLAIAETPVSVNQGIIAMVCDGELPNLYVLHWTRANMDRVLANANGSTFMEISKRNFRPITAVVPSQAVMRCFMQMIEPMHRQIVSSVKQIQQLADLRDSLLPRLISGELVVEEAERIAGRAI